MSRLKNRILCIDDSKDNCDLMAFILTEAGFQVQAAYTFQEGVNLMQTRQFDLCLLDIFLPDGVGLDSIPKLQSIDPDLPIIICSGDGRLETREAVMQAGAMAFFTKPIDFDLLLIKVANLTDN